MTQITSVGAACDIVGGGTPSRKQSEFFGGSIPWVTIKDMKSAIITEPQEWITEAAIAASATRIVAAHSVLVATRVGLGKVAIAGRALAINQDIKALRPRGDLLPDYLYWHMLAHGPTIERLGVGATVKGITLDDLRDLPLCVPPIDEQRRIVDLLSRAAGLKRMAEEAQAKARELIPALFVDMFGTQPELRWPVVSFGSLVQGSQLGLVRAASQTDDAKPFPYVRMNSITMDGELDLKELKRVDATPREVERYGLRAGDFLFNTRNSRELVGKVAVFEAPGTYLFNNNILRVRFNEGEANPAYVAAAFATTAVQRELELRKSGTTTVFAIYYKNLSTLPVPLPPLGLQHKFAARCADIGAIRRLGTQAFAAAEQASAALMSRFFTT